jgi:hypothetical protein
MTIACQYFAFFTLAILAMTEFHAHSSSPDANSHQPIAPRMHITQHHGEQRMNNSFLTSRLV